jgi:hypothetical protein
MRSQLTFDFHRLRFDFTAQETIHFPPGKPGNVLRGAFAPVFRTLEPPAPTELPSGLADLPKPFVFRARHLDGLTIRPTESFSFEVNLFDLRNPAFDSLAQSFAEIAREGLSHTRGRATLENFVHQPMSLSLDPATPPIDKVRVDFLTPTELKGSDQPDFQILFARIRDRLSTLRTFYGPGPLDIDFKQMGDRATQIRMTKCDLRSVAVTRRSSRTGQVHGIGGFLGSATYEGELSPFLPYLTAAKWTGVGRQTTFGKGEIEVRS